MRTDGVTFLRSYVKLQRLPVAPGRGEQMKAEQDRAAARLSEAEAARDAARAELDEWMAGGPLARALRVFFYRRGQT